MLHYTHTQLIYSNFATATSEKKLFVL